MSNEVQEIVKLHKITTNTPKIKISIDSKLKLNKNGGEDQ